MRIDPASLSPSAVYYTLISTLVPRPIAWVATREADGARNLVMGDLNTDPGRLAETDASAARLRDFVGPGLPFEFISDVGPEATPTYGGALNIDHVMSDVFTGSCVSPGAPGGPPPVTGAVYFDHLPVICELPL